MKARLMLAALVAVIGWATAGQCECPTGGPSNVTCLVRFEGTPDFQPHQLVPGICAAAAENTSHVEAEAGYHDQSGHHNSGFPAGTIKHKTKKGEDNWSQVTDKTFPENFSGLAVTGWGPGNWSPRGSMARIYYTFPGADDPWSDHNVFYKYSFKTHDLVVEKDGDIYKHDNDLDLKDLQSPPAQVQLWKVHDLPLATNNVMAGTRRCAPAALGATVKRICEFKSNRTWEAVPDGTLPATRRF